MVTGCLTRVFKGVFKGWYRDITGYTVGIFVLLLKDCFRIWVLHICYRVYRNVKGFTGMSQGFYRWVTVRGMLRDLTEILQLSARVLSWYFSNTLLFLSHQISVLFKYIWIIFPLYSFSFLISVPFCISFLLSYQFFLILSTLLF